MFVTVDGPNGVGKTSVCRTLGARLQKRNIPVTLIREPSESSVGRFARQHQDELVGMPLAALVVADRYLQVETEIKPGLNAGVTVVCDRYVASTLVLQRIDGIDVDVLWQMNAQVLVPDLYVILSASAPTVYSRLEQRGRISRFERLSGIAELEITYFHDARRVLADAGYRVLVIDTDQLSIDRVVEQIEQEMSRI
ncbi:MAG: dTMP kinase [Candidatus Saccharimonadales bacterium]